MKKLLFCALACLSFKAFSAPPEVVDSLQSIYSKSETLADSLRVAVDIFDASPRQLQPLWAEKALVLAERAGDVELQLDLLRNIANYGLRDDQRRDWVIEKLNALPESNERDQTILFVNVLGAVNAARNASISENESRIHDLIREAAETEGRSPYTRIQVNFALCACLQQVSQGEILADYMEDLGEDINKLPDVIDPLISIYYTQSAVNYTEVGDHRRAVAADKKLLEHTDYLDRHYKAVGRKYRDQNYNRYIIIRRLLRNFEALTPEEVEAYFQRIVQLSQVDPRVTNDFNNYHTPEIYYYMSRREYAKALPLLQNALFGDISVKDTNSRMQLANLLVEASKQCGDDKTRLMAIEEYDARLQEMLEKKSTERWRELQIIYDVNSLKIERAEANQRLQEQTISSHRRIIVWGTIVLTLLVGFIVVLVRVWRRQRATSRRLQATNASLTEERDTLKRTQHELKRVTEAARTAQKQKEEFVNNISHEISNPVTAITEYSQLIVDCIDDDRNRYLQRFARVVMLNGELLQALVNDVLTAAHNDSSNIRIEEKPVSSAELASLAVDSVKNRVNPGVELINNIKPDDAVTLTTDAKRAMQVLVNLLSNATKFTTEGVITLDGTLNKDGVMYTFSVTDTGIGIKPGMEERIFQRFEKLDRHTQGIGLGLAIARMVASLLGGEVKVDTKHTGSGSRFLFTIPVK